jgi:glycosyltransferase involved in cell wall biosynthesis
VNIICFSDVSWNFLWQRQQQLISRFPKDWNILYIEPSFWKAKALKIINYVSRIRVPRNDNIIVKSIPTFPLVDDLRRFQTLNDWLIVNFMLHFIKKASFKEAVLILYHPRFSCVLGRMGESLSCYDVIDEKFEFEEVPQRLKRHHTFLIENVDLITVSSTALHMAILSLRDQDVFLIGNGADIRHFRRATTELKIPDDIVRIGKQPILGYLGAIGEWFDFSLLESILKTYPKVNVVLVGWAFNKQRLRIDKLCRAFPNLHFLGRRSYEDLPRYVKAFAVCIIPFRLYKLTEAINPTKVYEYMAAGKPVISTALPELNRWKELIYIANNSAEFLDFIETALKVNHDSKKISQAVSNEDWQYKVKEFLHIIESYKDKARGP